MNLFPLSTAVDERNHTAMLCQSRGKFHGMIPLAKELNEAFQVGECVTSGLLHRFRVHSPVSWLNVNSGVYRQLDVHTC